MENDKVCNIQETQNDTKLEFICKYCGKVCKSIYSLKTHETLCKQNPNKKISNFVKFNQSEKKYKNQFDKAKKLGLPTPEFSSESIERIRTATIERNKQRRKDRNNNLLEVYKAQCAFRFIVYNYPQEFDLTLVEQYGWYSPANKGNNLKGISRDHMFSCNEGFAQLIDPYLISHPANCKLMQQKLNSAKRDKCSITFDQLKERVNAWNEKYGMYTNTTDYSYFEMQGIVFHK